ncbi:MAG: hypothetical protein VR68_03030 [Peptococcaceae bacterium BRH_c4a]|nr:MAG: hypothetical protein VR68_03030 [Peptococcaceae bacterium BRH_c4a]
MPGNVVNIPLIISIIAAIIFYSSIYPSFSRAEGDQRQKSHQAISVLEGDAYLLTQELLVLDLKQKKAEEKKNLIEKDLIETRQKRNDALDEFNEALEIKKDSLLKVSPWINFQYRYGYWSLLDILIKSSSLSDLLNRSIMVSFILDQQGKTCKQAENACIASLQKEKALNDVVEGLDRRNKALGVQIQDVKKISEQRQEYLEKIKRTSRDLAQQVTLLERKLLSSINLFDLLIGAAARFPWQNVEPDRLWLGPGGVSVEISEKNLNGALQRSPDENLRGLSVNLKQGIFMLTGKDTKSNSTFTLGGTLIPVGENTAVKLGIKSMILDEIPVTTEVLGELAANSGFRLPLPESMKLYKLTGIDISEEKVTISLSYK